MFILNFYLWNVILRPVNNSRKMSTYLHNVGYIHIALREWFLFFIFIYQIELKGLRVSPFNFDTLLIVFGYFTPCSGRGQWKKYYYRPIYCFSFSCDHDNFHGVSEFQKTLAFENSNQSFFICFLYYFIFFFRLLQFFI